METLFHAKTFFYTHICFQMKKTGFNEHKGEMYIPGNSGLQPQI